MYGTMSMEVLEQRREEMPREADIECLKKALRADRKRSVGSRWGSTATWELERAAGLLRKFFRTLKNFD